MVGGTVNPTGSSLACPEAWFICKGTMFPAMTGGVLFEHGHRLVAMTVGLLQIGLTVLLWRRRGEWLSRLGVVAFVLVCAQGSLGAMTVKYQLPWAVSTAHLMTAFGYFALVIYLAWRTRPGAERAPARPIVSERMHTWIGIAAFAVFAQVTLGALVRHSGGALASVQLPLHDQSLWGSLWPAGQPLPLQLHLAHRIAGVLVGLLAAGVGIAAFRSLAGQRWQLRAVALLAPILVAAQVTLGVLVIWTLRSTPVVVAHVGVAAALWALFVTLWLGTRGASPAPVREASAMAHGVAA
jgi:heme A synthase